MNRFVQRLPWVRTPCVSSLSNYWYFLKKCHIWVDLFKICLYIFLSRTKLPLSNFNRLPWHVPRDVILWFGRYAQVYNKRLICLSRWYRNRVHFLSVFTGSTLCSCCLRYFCCKKKLKKKKIKITKATFSKRIRLLISIFHPRKSCYSLLINAILHKFPWIKVLQV